jgi:hypothetical protein
MSPLAKAVDDYLHLRRALGFKLTSGSPGFFHDPKFSVLRGFPLIAGLPRQNSGACGIRNSRSRNSGN